MQPLTLPPDLDCAINEAWSAAQHLPGFLGEDEGRFIAMAAASAPPNGAIVEIGSFKGKSTVILAKIAQRYGLGPVTAIDPHNFNNAELHEHRTAPGATSFDEFTRNLASAGVTDLVTVHRAYSTEIARAWNQPIRFLWIDGDHSYAGAKADFDGFAPYLIPGAIIAFHDALHEFAGPIRVFVEDVLPSDSYGAAGFVQSIAWAQYRPEDGFEFAADRIHLEMAAARLIPFLKDERPLTGLSKLRYKWHRSRVPRSLASPQKWFSSLRGV